MWKNLFEPGSGMKDLEAVLRRIASRRGWDIAKPLPTTRELGERYSVSNASVCRLLKRLDQERVLWRRENGRYYLPEAQPLLEKRKPYACLIRKLETWSRTYQGVMTGFSQAFGQTKAGFLFIHDDHLVQHPDIAHPPSHGNAHQQKEAMADFFHSHRDEINGVLLDDVWLDEVLSRFDEMLLNAVVVCRPTRLSFLSSVSIDADGAALLAMAHLYARGYDQVWVAVPFTNSAPIDLMVEASVRAAQQLGTPLAKEHLISVATPEERAALVNRLRSSPARVGVFCPEDNVTAMLARCLAQAGISLPQRVGLLSGMGTPVVSDLNISSLEIDYPGIGRMAADILQQRQRRAVTLPAALRVGQTT